MCYSSKSLFYKVCIVAKVIITFSIITILLISPYHISAQQNYCDTSLYSKANTLYNKALKDSSLSKSITLLRQAVKIDTTFAQGLFKLGENLHLKAIISQYDIREQQNTNYYFRQSEKYLLKTLDLCPELNDYASYYYIGEQYYLLKEYSLSEHYLSNYLTKQSSKTLGVLRADKYYNDIKQWKKWRKNPYTINIHPVETICTSDDEFFPAITPNGQHLYFTRQSNKVRPGSIYSSTITEFIISSVTDMDSLENWTFANEKIMDYPFNEDIYFENICIGNNEMYLTQHNKVRTGNRYSDIGKIYLSHKSDGFWESPEPLPYPLYAENSFTGQPTISSNGKILIFSSNRSGGYGGFDLYYCRQDSTGKWSAPINMGDTINTINDENTPFLHYDNKTLYFASNGHFGMGGFDIFLSRLDKSGIWSVPINLGVPINTPADESGFIADARGIKGYRATKYLPGKGGWDIYSFDIPEPFRPTEHIIISGIITKTVPDSYKNLTINISEIQTGEKIKVAIDTSSATFSAITTYEATKLYIETFADKFSFSGQVINIPTNRHSVFVKTNLTKINIGSRFFIDQIYFDKNENINKNAEIILAGFARYLKTYKSLNIKINIINSNDIYNSESLITRANIIKMILTHNGVESKRISTNKNITTTNQPNINPTNSQLFVEITGI